MRTTLELPDDLFRKLKLRAVSEGKTLKTIVHEIIMQAVNNTPTESSSWKRPTRFGKLIRGEAGPAMKRMSNQTIAELEEADDQ
jgi:hypothetical protein